MGGAALAEFSTVRAWLLERGWAFGHVEADRSGAVLLRRPRATVAVVEAGAALPETFDVLVVVGSGEQLAAALGALSETRIQLLPLPSPAAVAERVLAEATAAADAFAQARVADQLLEIGRILNAERDPGRVLERILREGRAITQADAGSIYVVEDGGKRLRFCFAHNDSIATDFTEFSIPVTPTSIVGSACLSGRSVRVSDLYGAGESMTRGRVFHHDRSFDERLGYQTRSMITTPMITPDGRVIGVIQLINARRDRAGALRTKLDFDTRVRAFTEEDERLCEALAGQAATALENAQLVADIQKLFEGFVRASVHAIEQRDPTTSGHSQRVADLTVGLAKAADRSEAPRFAAVSFTPAQLREIEYAGLLHDFGKVGVREEVLVKAKKLYPQQLELLLARLDHMRTALQVEVLQHQLASARAGRPDDEALAREHQRRADRLDELLRIVLRANEPNLLPEDASARLSELSELRFVNSVAEEIQVVGPREVEALMIPRGSLTASEREEIQAHVTHTYDFLVMIPWTPSLAGVPEIAAKHHEYLDGTGYPRSLPEPEIPLQARMMTVADIYDALTASDRPYKKAVPSEKAIDILYAEVKAGKVDLDVLELFVQARVFEAIGAPR
jgi:HD-GYP domain-containing protein (c-di-GMP phosphodiesterase class II)